MLYTGPSHEQLFMGTIRDEERNAVNRQSEDVLTILWNLDQQLKLIIDGVEFIMEANQLVFLTEFHRVKIIAVGTARIMRFNRAFYCIVDHDQEVSCKGVLFFGASQVPLINVIDDEVEKFEILWRMIGIEMESRDNLQREMLQMMLKRFVILSTRLYKTQNRLQNFDKIKLDVVREFNFLVETHFKDKHTVAEYAALLNKSPKTISNLFLQYNQKSPLQVIQDRIMLEARRLLFYTDKSIKEIAYETGFEDIQSFSRFFKVKEGVSPREYKEKIKPSILQGSFANSTGNSD